ncbi:GH15080 [Drosophila grimshawi]|uniref:GH15080 n=2 Tax=Drosophila grimshawi TaxID=7222 RepID=B4IZB2_DROGR|nr:GH15080 [Drosophila grimshawi]
MSTNTIANAADQLANDVDLAVMQCDEERLERKSLVLWRRPLMTLKYGILEVFMLLLNLGVRLLDRRLMICLLILVFIHYLPGPHVEYMQICRQNLGFIFYWLGLGLLSSMGFGTGLHTFLLYLGPHIAAVTLAAYECQSLDFPTPPYPELKICPQEPYVRKMPNMCDILSKVRIEATLWGVGTALGELPPYFMARAARLSGKRLAERQQVSQPQNRSDPLNLFDKCKDLIERVVLRVGFVGILLCASVPNPLFDLAGVACGHFLVPFWKFFVATLMGKAIVKTSLQQVLVIVAFSEDLVAFLVKSLGKVPLVGSRMQSPIENLLTSTKLRMHHKTNGNASFTSLGLVSNAFQILSIVIMIYFGISMLNVLAQRHCKRLQLQARDQIVRETVQENSESTESEVLNGLKEMVECQQETKV